MVIMPLTIAAGTALSDSLEISSHLQIVRIAMPTAWDAAPITFSVSLDGVVWYDLHRAAATAEGLWVSYEVGIKTVIPSSIMLLPSDAGANINWLRFRSGTHSVPVEQSADRVFKLVLEPTS
jgi:hypothetical protein